MAWAFPGRLPLGAGFCGTCRAAGEATDVVPDDAALRDSCNLGHAHGCSRMPVDRRADSVRLAVAKDLGERIVLNYVYDLDHLPVEHGQLEYNCATQSWLFAAPDACLQRQAECYLAVYLERRPRPVLAAATR
ncbi:MAG TPA: hypothetical protein VKL40_16185 [Candidatus Angelobacter sp.]|nr:hypothetical protein [Candidatus Angelobacter sp.]